MGKYFEKTALNAMKARELAKSVGIIPEAQWKWGLRKLRAPKVKDGPMMLEGKALRKAKEERIGLLSNNEIQAIKATQRKQRLGHEIALSEGKGNPKNRIIKGGKGYVDTGDNAARAHTHPPFNKNDYDRLVDPRELNRIRHKTLNASPSGMDHDFINQEVAQSKFLNTRKGNKKIRSAASRLGASTKKVKAERTRLLEQGVLKTIDSHDIKNLKNAIKQREKEKTLLQPVLKEQAQKRRTLNDLKFKRDHHLINHADMASIEYKHNILSESATGVHTYRGYKLPKKVRSVYFKGGLDG